MLQNNWSQINTHMIFELVPRGESIGNSLTPQNKLKHPALKKTHQVIYYQYILLCHKIFNNVI